MTTAARLSIIVPVLDEADNLARLLSHLRGRCPDAEVIVADGGSADRTALVMRAWPPVWPIQPASARRIPLPAFSRIVMASRAARLRRTMRRC